MSGLPPGWMNLRSTALWLLLLAFCLYLPSLFYGNFADDDIYLAYTGNMVRELPWTELYQFVLKRGNSLEFLPLRDLSYWLDFRLFGDEPMGFHSSNLFWYALSALGAGWLFRELIILFRPQWENQASVLALCGTVLFVAHPAHVEAVVWIASRKDLIAGALGFFSIAAFARGIRCGWRFCDFALSALLLMAACFGKAAATTNLIILSFLTVACWRSAPNVSASRKAAILLLVWAVVVLALVIHLITGDATGIRIDNDPGFHAVLERASRIFTTLAGILLVPHDLGLYYDVYHLGAWHWLATAAGAVLFLLAIWAALMRRALWALGVILAVSSWAVSLQVVPFTTWSMASERFVFVAVAGLALIIVDLLGRMANPRRIATLMLALVSVYAIVILQRLPDWEYNSTLMAREYERQPYFHNAMRDRIMFQLLPDKRYPDAQDLARNIRRTYAQDAVFALIDTEVAYRRQDEIPLSNIGENKKDYGNFCSAVAALKLTISRGYAGIQFEADLSYNNLLRSLERQIDNRYSTSLVVCK